LYFLFLQTSVWNSLHPDQIVGGPALVKEFDCLKATLEEVSVVRSQFRIPIDSGNLKIAGFAGWFDVHFRVRFYHFMSSLIILERKLNAYLILLLWLFKYFF
jgi:hypothetical protein